MFSLIISILFTLASAWVDCDTLRYGYIESHKSRFIQRAIFFIPLAYINVLGALGGALIFAAMFDQTLNKMRRMSWFYLGTVATWDKFFNKRPMLYISLKIICLFMGVYLCLYGSYCV